MIQLRMLVPIAMVAAGFLLLGLRKKPSPSGRLKQALPLPKSSKQRAQFRVMDAIDLTNYPKRTRRGAGGRQAFVKDWSAANLRSSIAFLMPHVRGAMADPKVGAPFKQRAAWLLRAMEDFLKRP